MSWTRPANRTTGSYSTPPQPTENKSAAPTPSTEPSLLQDFSKVRSVFVGIEQKVKDSDTSIFLNKDQLVDVSKQGSQTVVFGGEGTQFIEGSNTLLVDKEDKVKLGDKVTLTSLVETENGTVSLNFENPLNGSRDKKQKMVLNMSKDDLKNIQLFMGSESNSAGFQDIKKAIKTFLNPPSISIHVPKANSQFITVKEAEKKYGKIDGSFKNDQSAELIDVNDLNKKGLDVVGIDDRVNIPEGTTVKKSRIQNNKNQTITLVELTLPDGVVKAFLIPSKIEAKINRILIEKQGPPAPADEVPPSRRELRELFDDSPRFVA